MSKQPRSADPQSAFCEVCLKRVPKSEAVTAEAKNYTAYFCSSNCYERWRGERAPQPPPHEVQEGQGQSKSRDERMKRLIKQHPQRDEPRADSVERDDVPPGR
jgi:YHS domain-containing protein